MTPLKITVEPSEIECPCCHGERVLVVRDAATGDVSRVACCHCNASGRIFLDQRSDNRHE